METKIKSIKHQLIDEKNQREIAVDKVMELNMQLGNRKEEINDCVEQIQGMSNTIDKQEKHISEL